MNKIDSYPDPFVLQCLGSVLKGKKILLGVTGSIAAFKAHELVRILMGCGASVRVVLTESAQKFVTPLTLETLTGEPVLRSFWDRDEQSGLMGTHHISTARWADLVLVAPATANIIARIAGGLADDLLSTEVLAFEGKTLIAPAMNPSMFAKPVTQENIARLRARGFSFIDPVTGDTACGEVGVGRMAEPWAIVEAVAMAFFAPKNGKRAVVTLGATRSFMDPVRFMTNRSSGRMGAAFCWALQSRGYHVTAVVGSVNIDLPGALDRIDVTTAAQMAQVALGAWKRSDLFVGAAAVLDWDFVKTEKTKLKKEKSLPAFTLKKNIDIVAEAGRQKKPGQFVLAFAAETDRPIENAKKKLLQKRCQGVFVNDVSKADRGFETHQNAGWYIDGRGVQEIPLMSKVDLANYLIESAIRQGKIAKSSVPKTLSRGASQRDQSL